MGDLLEDLDRRGLLHDSTDRGFLAARLAEGPITLYYGCDPTAPSLHHGNLIGLVMLRRFQDAGHRPIALAGGATGMIGDPGGRSEERNLLDAGTLAANVAAITGQITRVLGPEGRWMLVDNMSWTGDVRLLDFLRDVGKHVTVNQMVARESVRTRMDGEHGISYTEFSYMLLQANDYAHLHEQEGCELQIGGSDQWGNILSGVDLIRRRRGASVHGLCWPLLTAGDGTKIGKSAGARVWLDPEMTRLTEFFNHFMGTPDDEVGRLLAQLTLLPMDDVDALVSTHREAPDRRLAQWTLAGEITELVHGSEARAEAEEASAVLFPTSRQGAPRQKPQDLGDDELRQLEQVLPVSTRRLEDLPVPVAELFAGSGLTSSRSAATRLATQGGAYVNDVRVEPDQMIGRADVLHGRWLLLRSGKKQRHLIILE